MSLEDKRTNLFQLILLMSLVNKRDNLFQLILLMSYESFIYSLFHRTIMRFHRKNKGNSVPTILLSRDTNFLLYVICYLDWAALIINDLVHHH